MEKLPSFVPIPFISNFRPEIDLSPELTPPDASYYQSLIDTLRWIVKLGKVDITCEVSMMVSMTVMSQEGHLTQVYHILAYLERKYNVEMVFDPSYLEINEDIFPEYDWNNSPYSHAKEPFHNDAPKAKGLGFKIVAFVDSDHTGQ